MNKFTGWIMKLEILLALGLCFYQPKIPPPPVIHHDPRIAALATFEAKHHFLPNDNIKEIIKAADKCDLTPALLVAIDLQESSGGRYYLRSTNNEWGWASDTRSFESETAAIDYISQQLCFGKYYAGKSLEGKIRAYNPNPSYLTSIIKSINEIKSYESKTP